MSIIITRLLFKIYIINKKDYRKQATFYRQPVLFFLFFLFYLLTSGNRYGIMGGAISLSRAKLYHIPHAMSSFFSKKSAQKFPYFSRNFIYFTQNPSQSSTTLVSLLFLLTHSLPPLPHPYMAQRTRPRKRWRGRARKDSCS